MSPYPRGVTPRIAAGALLIAAVAVLLAPELGPAVPSAATAAPTVTALPTVSGTAAKGKTLTASSGSWAGSTPITFAYRWVRCDASGSGCTDISGATSSTYVIDSSVIGKRLRVRVTATNGDGTAAALSEATAVVTDGAPTNTAEPRITGTATQGQTLSATSGSWTGSPTFAYRWVRCGSDGGRPDGSNCSPVDAATSATYTLTSSDVGRRMRIRVTATNASGSTTAASNPTSTVKASIAAGRPANTAEPVISGTAAVGQTLTTTAGSWSGSTPITVSYRWTRCGSDGGKPDASNCSTIRGATSASYTLTSDELGRRIRVKATARNTVGSTTVASNATAVVAPAGPPGLITLPNGDRSIPASSVPSDQRLVVDSVVFSPNPVRSRTAPITVRIRVKDTRGYVVRDARVFIRPTPLVTSGSQDGATATDGWLQVTLVPRPSFPQIRSGFSVQFYVKAFRSGDPTLGGVSGTRLVQVALGG
jgi:hypothetical protein